MYRGCLDQLKRRQKPWKAPLPEFIEELYFQHFKKSRPESRRWFKRKKAERKVGKQAASQSQPSAEEESPPE